jgi:hypothetical protein
VSAKKKTSPRQRHQQKVRMLKAAARRAEKRGNESDALWARAQLEIRTGEIMPTAADRSEVQR